MDPGCISEEKLPVVMRLTPEDPARRHLEGCARCRARLAVLSAFAQPQAPPSGSRPEEADRQLAAVLGEEIYGRPPGNRVRTDARGPSDGGLGSILRMLWRPAMRPVWAVGLVILAVVGVRELGPGRDDRIILREDGGQTASSLLPMEPVVDANGRMTLRWSPQAETTQYTVVLLGEDLEERERIDAGGNTSCPLPDETLSLLRAGSHMFWRVIAQREGDTVASSKTVPLALPRAP
jgi:hypothetical protein